MNFFERQDQAHRNTRRLVFLFIMATILTALAIHSVVAILFACGITSDAPQSKIPPLTWNLYLAAWCNLRLLAIDIGVVFLIIAGASFCKMAQLSSLDGRGIAEMMGGRQIPPDTTNFQERRILNIVEEMAIASGVHCPDVFILENEPGINAFAAGFSVNKSVIGVTQGALDYLTRDELQGVIGHEFSHICNEDTKINLRLMGILFGLEMFVLLGMILCRNSVFFTMGGSSRDSDGESRGSAGAAIAVIMILLGLALIIIGMISRFFSYIIQMAISRQREFLADASAVQFTRNPAGIAGALKKIGCSNVGSQVHDSNCVQASHMFFGNIFSKGFFSSLFDSHPDLTVRIQTIDPTFDGVYPETVPKVGLFYDDSANKSQTVSSSARLQEVINKTIPVGQYIPDPTTSVMGGVTVDGLVSSAASQTVPPVLVRKSVPSTSETPWQQGTPSQLASSLVNSIGETRGDDLAIASSLLQGVPAEITELVRNPLTVCAVVYALLVDQQRMIRQKQLAFLGSREQPEVIASLQKALPLIDSLPPSTKVPVAELAYPSLKYLDKERYKQFRNIVVELIKSDGKVDIFEYTIQEYLLRDLDDYFRLRAKPRPVYRNISDVASEFQTVLSYLAYQGNDDAAAAESAYRSGMSALNLNLPFMGVGNCTPLSFSQGLGRLMLAEPLLKQKLLHGFYRCIVDDGKITETEGELIRAISATLDCPMPGWASQYTA